MTQNTEQNVWTREEQLRSLMGVISPQAEYPLVADLLSRHLAEAEARGAEEQRRKDADGQEPFGYLITEHSGDGNQSATTFTKHPVSPEDMSELQLTSLPVYDRPANVAALEARVKELDEAIQFHDRVKAASVSEKIAVGQDAYNRMDAAMRSVVAALKREGGV